jgi:hypothetical protein
LGGRQRSATDSAQGRAGGVLTLRAHPIDRKARDQCRRRRPVRADASAAVGAEAQARGYDPADEECHDGDSTDDRGDAPDGSGSGSVGDGRCDPRGATTAGDSNVLHAYALLEYSNKWIG